MVDKNKQRTILCYGDSNTWGLIAESADYETMTIKRYPRSVRWPGLLQTLMGDRYYVVEEGLNGRTTNLDYHVQPDRNGKTYLPACLYSHAPIDLVVILLGGNDLKSYFNRSADDICQGILDLIDLIQSTTYGPNMKEAPKILIVSQPIPLVICEEFRDYNGNLVFKDAIRRAELMVRLYSKLSREKDCFFLDISSDVRPTDIDGMHLDENGHKKLALLVQKKIDDIFLSELYIQEVNNAWSSRY